MKKTKFATMFLAIVMIISVFSFTTFAAYNDVHDVIDGFDCYGDAEKSDNIASAVSLITSDSGSGTARAIAQCSVLYISGEWGPTRDDDTGYTAYSNGAYARAAVVVRTTDFVDMIYTEHHFYANGSYLDTLTIDLYCGEDLF